MLGNKVINLNLVLSFHSNSFLKSLLKFSGMGLLHCFDEVKVVSFLGAKLVVETVKSSLVLVLKSSGVLLVLKVQTINKAAMTVE